MFTKPKKAEKKKKIPIGITIYWASFCLIGSIMITFLVINAASPNFFQNLLHPETPETPENPDTQEPPLIFSVTKKYAAVGDSANIAILYTVEPSILSIRDDLVIAQIVVSGYYQQSYILQQVTVGQYSASSIKLTAVQRSPLGGYYTQEAALNMAFTKGDTTYTIASTLITASNLIISNGVNIAGTIDLQIILTHTP